MPIDPGGYVGSEVELSLVSAFSAVRTGSLPADAWADGSVDVLVKGPADKSGP